MSHVNESCLTWMSHVSHERVMSDMTELWAIESFPVLGCFNLCVAVCSNVLQGVLKCAAACCSVLQRVLQCAAASAARLFWLLSPIFGTLWDAVFIQDVTRLLETCLVFSRHAYTSYMYTHHCSDVHITSTHFLAFCDMPCLHDMMIAFITFNSNLVLLIEGLCTTNPCKFEFSVLDRMENEKRKEKKRQGTTAIRFQVRWDKTCKHGFVTYDVLVLHLIVILLHALSSTTNFLLIYSYWHNTHKLINMTCQTHRRFDRKHLQRWLPNDFQHHFVSVSSFFLTCTACS